MDKLKTMGDIDIFACKLLDANINLPINVSIEIKLSKKEYDKIVPKYMEKYNKMYYNTMGIKVLLTTKDK